MLLYCFVHFMSLFEKVKIQWKLFVESESA